MNNFGMGFGWGQAGMGGGSQMPWGNAFNQARRGMGGMPQVSPYQQQRPVLPPMNQPRPVSPMPPRMPPVQRGIANPPTQNRFQTPLKPPTATAYGANQGAFAGRPGAAQSGSIPDPTNYLNRELQNPGFQPGFLSVPPEPMGPEMTSGESTPMPPAPATPFSTTSSLTGIPQHAMGKSAQLYNRLSTLEDPIVQSHQNTQLPDATTSNFRGITPQQAFQQIPGNPFSKMGDRFTAIAANRPPVEPPMTASQPTSTMPNYSQRVRDVNPTTADNINNPQYMADNRITPMPRAGGQLTPLEAATMQAAGSSIGEWKAKSDWLTKNGYQSMTPEAAQKYAAEQQQKRFARNDQEDMARQRDNQRLDVDRQWRMRRRDQNFRYNNPGLYNTPDFTAAQLAAVMAGAPITQFQQPGLTPQQAIQAQLQVRQQGLQQAQTQAALGMNAEAEQSIQSINPMIGFGGGQQQFQPTAPPQPQLYSDQYRPTQPPMGVGMTDPNAVVRRGQEHRNEDGSINPGTFYPKLLANMGSAQQILNSGINEEDLRQYIKSQEGMVWNSPDNQRRIDNAKKALALIAPQSATGSAASSAVSGAGNPIPLGARL